MSFKGGLILIFLRLSDAASAQPRRLLHASLAVVVPPVRDPGQSLRRAGGAVLSLPGTADVHPTRPPADPLPGEMLPGLLLQGHAVARDGAGGVGRVDPPPGGPWGGLGPGWLCRHTFLTPAPEPAARTWARVAAPWSAGAHRLRAGAAPRGTGSGVRAGVEARANRDGSGRFGAGSRVVRAGVAALSASLEVCSPCRWFGFRSHGWRRWVSPGLVQRVRSCGRLG